MGVDTLGAGHWLIGSLFTGGVVAQPGGGERRLDSLVIIQVARDLREVDTVARIGGGEVIQARIEGTMHMTNAKSGDRAIAFADGWIAVAFQDPYHVDWMRPGGEWIRGVELAPIPSGKDGRMPAFTRGARSLAVAPDGRLLIRRAASDDSSSVRYDVVNRTGRLDGYFLLTRNERVVGSGRQTIYVVRTDSLGLERIIRVDWPAVSR
jgi:hypothetical protein